MKTISQNELVSLLRKVRGATIVTIEAETKPSMRKKLDGQTNPFQEALKLARVNGMINWKYENSVNNQRKREDKEADFTPESRSWGKRPILEDGKLTPLVEHKDKLYLELKVQHSDKEYYLNGKSLDEEEIKPWLKVSEARRQQLEKPVILRDYSLENIRKISIGGQKYEIKK